jgi:hypothetical protein
MAEWLEQVEATTDPIGLGYLDDEMLALGFEICPFDFPHVDGVVVLRRRLLYPTPQAWADSRIVGSAATGLGSVQNMPGFGHEAGMGYQFAGQRVFGNGYGSPLSKPVRVDFDDEGAVIDPPLPKWPIELQAQAIAGGKFEVSWAYDGYGQGSWPTDFAVYGGVTVAAIDYDTPLGTVDFRDGTVRYRFTTDAFDEGTKRAFAVRARNVTPVAEKNLFATAVKTALATGPAAAEIYLAATRRGGGRCV